MSSAPPGTSLAKDAAREAIAGAIAGAFAKTLVAPIDRIKLLVQLQGSVADKSALGSGSIWDIGRNIIKNEGFVAFWRGNSPNLLIQAGTSSLNFVFYDSYKKAASHILQLSHASELIHDERKRILFSSLLSGGLAGGSTITVLYPLGFMRTRLAADVGAETRLYPRGMRDVFLSTLKTDGIRGLYSGYAIALASVSLYRVVYLGGYDVMKKEIVNRKTMKGTLDDERFVGAVAAAEITVYERFFAAQLVSIVASITHYPLDSVRRRLMMQASRSERQYTSAVDCFRKVYCQEGMRGFYLGLGPNIVRSFGAALVLVSYDAFKALLW